MRVKALLKRAENNLPNKFDLHQVEELGDIKMIENYCKTYNLSDNSIEGLFLNKAKELRLL